jgi:alkanesulfonate monooxygenase SsuD/methylene tetrahydromethanopterin reductase-like flavin-dependent oxidoreductase (luciferase family)
LKAGYGGYPLIGTANDVASGLQLLSELGFDGVALTYVDFVDGLRRFNADVLPVLEQAGLRKPYAPASTLTA